MTLRWWQQKLLLVVEVATISPLLQLLASNKHTRDDGWGGRGGGAASYGGEAHGSRVIPTPPDHPHTPPPAYSTPLLAWVVRMAVAGGAGSRRAVGVGQRLGHARMAVVRPREEANGAAPGSREEDAREAEDPGGGDASSQ